MSGLAEIYDRVAEQLQLHRTISGTERALREAGTPVSRATVVAVAAQLGIPIHVGRPRGPGKKYSEHRKRACDLAAAGNERTAIAALLGISPQAVSQLLKPVSVEMKTYKG